MTDDFWKLEDAMPCPFCGSKDVEHGYLDDEGYESDNFYVMESIYARCTKCGCRIVFDDNKPDTYYRPDMFNERDAKKAITERWNDRRSLTPEEMFYWLEIIRANRMRWIRDSEAYNGKRLVFINKETGYPATEEEMKEIREKMCKGDPTWL